jgi:hypothetical protein
MHEVLIDLIYLHRNNPIVKPFFMELKSRWHSEALHEDAARPEDVNHLRRIVARHEGEDSAALAAHWYESNLRYVRVFRDGENKPHGFVVVLPLHALTEADLEADPPTGAVWRYLKSHAPLRPGEKATFFRFWMADETYQDISTVQSLAFVMMVRHYLTTPGLAYSFLPCSAPEIWAPIFAYANLFPLPEADFTVGGRAYGVFGHDWRVEPPHVWLDTLAERAPTSSKRFLPPPQSAPVLVLSEPDFAEAVHDALRVYTRPDKMVDNPLLRSRLVLEECGTEADTAEQIDVLHGLLDDAIAPLQETPRDAKYHRALYRTYVKPAASQEQAAELLDVPYSTFRRHLKVGIERVTALLWARELGEY